MKKLTETRSKATVAILFLGLTAATIATATAAHLNVPADYSTIQAAVDAAENGDRIQIAPGVYTGQVLISDKRLTLAGSAGTSPTSHSAPGASRCWASSGPMSSFPD
jgi:serine protease